MKHTIPIILTVLSIFASNNARSTEITDTVTIRFNQGKSNIDYSLSDNNSQLMLLDSIASKNGNLLTGLRIVGAASPEGSVNLNNRLSDKRAEIILSLFEKNASFNDSISTIDYLGRDWNGLLNLAQRDNMIPYKQETILLLSNIVEKINKDGAETEDDRFLESLKNLKGGIPYSYLYTNIFPLLRTSRVYVGYSAFPQIDTNLFIPYLDTNNLNPQSDIILINPFYAPKEHKNFYMALKTNMLLDVLALPSLSAEFYLGKNLSAVANWTYGWWDNDRSHHYWRAYGGDLALRWWFGKAALEKPLTGHHIGIYGGIFTFDFEFGGTGYMGGLPHETLWNRSLRTAGIEYGYSLPVAKRLNIDFTIGIGYMGGKYIKYIPDNGRYLWQSTHKINWFGPTKTEISLVWLIGRGNYNKSGKGGKL